MHRELTEQHGELGAKLRQLAATPYENDRERSAQRARAAHELAEEVRRVALACHYEAAVVHRLAADLHQLAAEEGLGDTSAHRDAAERERKAARRELEAAASPRPHCEPAP